MEPPRAQCRAPMIDALLRNSLDKVLAVLADDETAAVFPFTDGAGSQVPIIKAASFRCSAEVMEALIRHGANPSSPEGAWNLTPLAVLCGASEASAQDFVEPPRFRKSDPGVCLSHQLQVLSTSPLALPELLPMPRFGVSPLCLQGQTRTSNHPWCLEAAAKQKSADEPRLIATACVLLRAGADPYHKDAVGRTPADWSEASGYFRLASLLRYRSEFQTVHLLRTLRSRAQRNLSGQCRLLDMHDGIHNILCKFLVPDQVPDSARQ